MKKLRKFVASLLAVSSISSCLVGFSVSADEQENNIEFSIVEDNEYSITPYSNTVPYEKNITVSGDYATTSFTAPYTGEYNVVFGVTSANSGVTVTINGVSYTYVSNITQQPFKVNLDANNTYTIKLTKVGTNTVTGVLKITRA